jgi:biopolymer transport protein ExbD
MKLQPKENDDIEIDMSPMIDMVFLLLIFFIVASTVIDEKIKVEDIPTAVFATVPTDTVGRAIISVRSDEDIFFGLNPRALSLDELKRELQAAQVDSKAKGKELKILIRSDGNVKYEQSEKIMKVCGEAGVTSLIYAAYEAGEVE